MFADDVFTKTRTLIGANAACNTSNHAANRRAARRE
jgi:hypothetical protein